MIAKAALFLTSSLLNLIMRAHRTANAVASGCLVDFVFLDRVAEKAEVNKMGVKNLIVIFGPTLMTTELFSVSVCKIVFIVYVQLEEMIWAMCVNFFFLVKSCQMFCPLHFECLFSWHVVSVLRI